MDDLGFLGFTVLLCFDNTAGEDDVFEIEDRNVFIFQLFRGMKGYNVFPRPNEVANTGDRPPGHTAILSERQRAAWR